MKMTDKEITDIIIVKVMGWIIAQDGSLWIDSKTLAPVDNFNPLKSDNDCMMAWDECEFDVNTLMYLSNEGFADIFHHKTGTDRRRAMCECMVKAA